ncbi:DUF6213 family protein [Streptomyces sp. NPDC089799]|uniref:DUF6213 family protein n=1 Tax=Streptomyces sp. NPDC089799 TaxID=3155066 RepID=UPI00341CF0A0
MSTSLSAMSAADGRLLIPAEEVTGLLRRLGTAWIRSAEETGGDLEPETVLALAGALYQVADQIDSECIAWLPVRPDGE